jgi:D-alanyl-D-alanine carboxypeptidase/D-alanyl-D-alanine-endopeptidase (penicillin-binding protein 4)
MNPFFFFLLFLLQSPNQTSSRPVPAPSVVSSRPALQLPSLEAKKELEKTLKEVLARKAFRFARVGFVLRSIRDSHPLFSHNGRMGFMTASNMKLVSSATALQVLGPKHHFETKFFALGKKQGGIWEGDIEILGSGDPTFGAKAFCKKNVTEVFDGLIAALKKEGISEIRGDVLGVDDVQPDEIMGLGWDWSYQADWYAAQVSGLCFNENCMDFLFSGTELGKPLGFRLEPETSYITVRNKTQVVPAGKGYEVIFHRGLGTNVITLSGTFPLGKKNKRDWGSVENPTGFCAQVCKESLERKGIRVRGRARDRDELEGYREGDSKKLLYVHRSPSIAEIVFSLNKRSQNLYAEQLVRMAGKARGGDGSMRAARRTAKEVLTQLGVSTEQFLMADGSGLSRLNLVKPRLLAGLLAGMWKSENRNVFLNSLPIAGVDGTLKRRFPKGHPGYMRVHAKTGFINKVIALSGYIPRRAKDPLVFSILVNDFFAPHAQIIQGVDDLVAAICRLAGPM